jgi:hypothetical protein
VSFCPHCSKPLDQRAAACPHCAYDFPTSPPVPASGPDWLAIVFGSLWVVCGAALVFFSPGRTSDWCLAGFAITGGLTGFLVGVRPLLGPDAARLAGPAAVSCAAIATIAAVASLCLGERDSDVVIWLVVAGSLGVFYGVRLLLRRVRGRGIAERSDA